MHQPADRRAVRYVYLVVKKLCHEKKAKETDQHRWPMDISHANQIEGSDPIGEGI